MWLGFLATDPYEFVPDKHPETGKPILHVRRAEPLPLCLAPIVGDVAHNLRASLDHLIPQLILANGQEPNYEATEFPIGKNKASYESKKARQVEGISDAASKFMDRIQPYKGGTEAFWQIHHLDVVDKHRLVVAVAASHGRRVTREHWAIQWGTDGEPGSAERVEASRENPAIYVPRNMPNLEVDIRFDREQDFEPIPAIALAEPGIGDREALLPALNNLVRFTEEVIMAFAEGEKWGGVPAGSIGVLVPVRIPTAGSGVPPQHLDEGHSEWRRVG